MKPGYNPYVYRNVHGLVLILGDRTAGAEVPAPSVHWGGLAYSDQISVLITGITLNRFTEFNGDGERNPSSIDETIGSNVFPGLWTEREESCGFHLTGGGGPTHNQPAEFLQNDFVHAMVFDTSGVPVGKSREAVDFMLGGAITRWFSVGETRENTFVGIRVTSGTLYHEPYARIGFRRIPFPVPSVIGHGSIWVAV